MVRASTQQTVDRIVGTAAVIGLSIIFVRWLSNPPSMLEEEKCKKNRKQYSWMPSWWPVIAIQRWDKRNRSEKDGAEDEQHVEKLGNDDGEYAHQGSCHCGSIKFVLKGQRRLRAVDSPGKIRYPHVPTAANKFQLLCGESNMRFYYEDDNDDSSSITFDHAGEERNDSKQASGAHVFCGSCGVHVFHADRSSGELEVNANCLDGLETKLVFSEQSSSGLSSITNNIKQQGKLTPLSRSQSSLSSTLEAENANDVEQRAKNATIETVSENEPFLGSARFLESLDDNRNNSIPRKQSLSSDPTQSESYSTIMMTEGDDSSMGSSSITGASMTFHHSSLSVASGAASAYDRTNRTGLPPLPPSRIPSSDRSVKTLPPRFGERLGYTSGGVMGGVGSSWSVASIETNDLDGADVGKTTISPRMRDQMKKYMGRHMSE
eukprot:CAMPEP_0172316508 /NCGR_PEP_ID=MMETSP1058-20130122/28486_1 /TAXON_ID=83371 /ORGANISM="Detonula confervacea, Strain CCMP 353" /LENGTH=433 /DNA_ID=CAMNT_0013030829 /DNA_START=252 /DNA_END=1553 /DNA_ORIENTATION=-